MTGRLSSTLPITYQLDITSLVADTGWKRLTGVSNGGRPVPIGRTAVEVQ